MDATPSQPLQLTRRHGFANTGRVDAWWLQPAATALGLAVFFGYLTFRAFNGTHVWYEPYVSPTVAPPLFTPASGYPGSVPLDHAWLGAFPGIAIFLAVLGFNILGDGIRDALDPRLKT